MSLCLTLNDVPPRAFMSIAGSVGRGSTSKVVDVLRRSGHRNTQQRLRVYEAVLEADRKGEHPDTAAVYKRVRAAGMRVALSRVYRALTTLEGLGLLRRHQLGVFIPGRRRFAEARSGAHCSAAGDAQMTRRMKAERIS